MERTDTYISYDDYSATYDTEKMCFTLCDGRNECVKNLRISNIYVGRKQIEAASAFIDCRLEQGNTVDKKYIKAKFACESAIDYITLIIYLGRFGFDFKIEAPKKCRADICADIAFGDTSEDTYPMSNDNESPVIRSAVGPAISNCSNMLFDRKSDSLIEFSDNKSVRLGYDWETGIYSFNASVGVGIKEKTLHIEVKKDVLSKEYGIIYTPVNKSMTFPKPPVGWMTWYAVKFDACEEKVLKNAKWLSENLKEYGANCIWVDWEWCHKDFSGSRNDGASMLSPDKEKYPNGLKFVSDKIRGMGLTPALWIGFTNESDEIDFIKENPDTVLVDKPLWCGRYFFDFTHPKYLNELLPMALKNVSEWGYDAVKYDTLPSSVKMHDRFHHKLYDTSVTAKEAYRRMIKKTREVLGENCYMLSCSSAGDQTVLWASDMFDAARVGDDIFEWDEFISRGVEMTLRYYPLHSNTIFLDCDNVVLREEFSDTAQAASRIRFVSMLGLPVTFGDEFDTLDTERIDLIKSCLPVLDIHPTRIRKERISESILKTDLAIATKWERYDVLSLFNTTDKDLTAHVDIQKDLSVDAGEYLVFDYSKNKFLGTFKDRFSLDLTKCESRILSIRRRQEIPQVISTSRHISQGCAEISDIKWSAEEKSLTLDAELIADAPYRVTLYVPDTYTPCDMTFLENNNYEKTVTPQKSGSHKITFSFK